MPQTTFDLPTRKVTDPDRSSVIVWNDATRAVEFAQIPKCPDGYLMQFDGRAQLVCTYAAVSGNVTASPVPSEDLGRGIGIGLAIAVAIFAIFMLGRASVGEKQ